VFVEHLLGNVDVPVVDVFRVVAADQTEPGERLSHVSSEEEERNREEGENGDDDDVYDEDEVDGPRRYSTG